jgi:hypothetical protein
MAAKLSDLATGFRPEISCPVLDTPHSTKKYPLSLFDKYVVWKMKKQTRILGLTFIEGHLTAA